MVTGAERFRHVVRSNVPAPGGRSRRLRRQAVWRYSRILLVALFALNGASPPARAMAITPADALPDLPPVLLLRGDINPGDSDNLISVVKTSNGQADDTGRERLMLDLDSPGGNVIEAEKMAKLIRQLDLGVIVRANAECASACFLLFAASLHRAAAANARVGVHSASLDGDENLLTLDMTTLMARDAYAFGVPPSVIGRMITTLPSDMAWLTDEELRQMNVERNIPPTSGRDPPAPLAIIQTPPDLPEAGSKVPLNTPFLSYRAGDAREAYVPSPIPLSGRSQEAANTAASISPVPAPEAPTIPAALIYTPGT